MATVTEKVKESLVGTEVEPQLSSQTRSYFTSHAKKDDEGEEYYMGEDEFVDAIAPEGEDYVSTFSIFLFWVVAASSSSSSDDSRAARQSTAARSRQSERKNVCRGDERNGRAEYHRVYAHAERTLRRPHFETNVKRTSRVLHDLWTASNICKDIWRG